MATPRTVKIIYDASPAEVSASHIQITTAPQIPAPPEAKLLSFSDLNQMYVKQAWVERCPLLNQPVIFESFELFKKYIYPILNGEDLRWSDNVDTKQEIGQLIALLKKYQLKLTPEQIKDISDNSGITKTLNMIKTYIYKHENKCIGRKTYQARYEKFTTTWDKYIDTLAIQYNDPVYREYKAQIIYNILTSDSMYNLLTTNILKNNIIYEFCDWFNSFIILQVDTFSDHLYDITSRLDLTNSMAPADIVTLIINMITNSKSETLAKSTLVQKITDLLKFRTISTPTS